VEVGHIHEQPDQKNSEVSWFVLLLHCGSSNTSVRCSVKCLSGFELSFDSFFTAIVSFVSLLESIVVFHCVFKFLTRF
jgi:hypothetical protein